VRCEQGRAAQDEAERGVGIGLLSTSGAALVLVLLCVRTDWCKEWRAVAALAADSRARNLKLTPLQLDAVRGFIQSSDERGAAGGDGTAALNPVYEHGESGVYASLEHVQLETNVPELDT